MKNELSKDTSKTIEEELKEHERNRIADSNVNFLKLFIFPCALSESSAQTPPPLLCSWWCTRTAVVVVFGLPQFVRLWYSAQKRPISHVRVEVPSPSASRGQPRHHSRLSGDRSVVAADAVELWVQHNIDNVATCHRSCGARSNGTPRLCLSLPLTNVSSPVNNFFTAFASCL